MNKTVPAKREPIDFELKPREPKTEQVWIYVNGELVEKCALVEKDARLTAHGYKVKRKGGYQSSAVKGVK